MSPGTTLDPALEPRRRAQQGSSGLALVVAWSKAEPSRAGEVILLPEGSPRLFGRGEPRGDDPFPRAALVRQRPARAGADGRTLGVTREARPPITAQFLSRAQLRLEAGPEDVRVENLGRCAMLVGDRKVTAARVAPGDTVELSDQLVLVCARRPAEMPPLYNVAEKLGPFGEADAQGLVGESPALWALRDRVAFFAARDVHVLLLGESGTGKELVARAIHALSPRGARPLVARNAATLPAGLVDAELFGNAKSYPQAGMPERPGLIGEADGGTLFLDEIGELPLDLQTHLLRVLDQRGEYQRLGESARRSADFRLIAATNRALSEMRSDLVARMSLRLIIPGLNDRREDIPLLARHLLRRIAARDAGIRRRFFVEVPLPEGGAALEPRIAPSLVRALIAHRYATHVRELDGILWQSLASSEGDTLELSGSVRQQLEIAAERGPAPIEITREVLEAVLAKHEGVKERVWRELGLQNRYALNRLLRKHGIQQGPATDADD